MGADPVGGSAGGTHRIQLFGRMPTNTAKLNFIYVVSCRVVSCRLVCRFFELIDHQLQKTETLHVRPNISLQLPTVDPTQG